MIKHLYTISEFAILLNISQETLRRWDRGGKLNAIKLPSGHRRYTKEHYKQITGQELNEVN